MLNRRAITRLVSIGLLVLLAFLTVVSPAVATLLTALCVAAMGVLLLLFLVSDRRRHGGMMGDLQKLLPDVLGIVKRRPMGAAGTALALGLAAELLQNGGKSSSDRRS